MPVTCPLLLASAPRASTGAPGSCFDVGYSGDSYRSAFILLGCLLLSYSCSMRLHWLKFLGTAERCQMHALHVRLA